MNTNIPLQRLSKGDKTNKYMYFVSDQKLWVPSAQEIKVAQPDLRQIKVTEILEVVGMDLIGTWTGLFLCISPDQCFCTCMF